MAKSNTKAPGHMENNIVSRRLEEAVFDYFVLPEQRPGKEPGSVGHLSAHSLSTTLKRKVKELKVNHSL